MGLLQDLLWGNGQEPNISISFNNLRLKLLLNVRGQNNVDLDIYIKGQQKLLSLNVTGSRSEKGSAIWRS